MGINTLVLALVGLAIVVGGIIAYRKNPAGLLNRVAVSGSMITGLLGWIFAINSMLDGNGIGAGTSLLASAVAFGVFAFLATRN